MKVYLGILDALQLDNKDPNDLLTLGVADAEPAHAPPPFGAMRSGRPGSRRLEPEEAGPHTPSIAERRATRRSTRQMDSDCVNHVTCRLWSIIVVVSPGSSHLNQLAHSFNVRTTGVKQTYLQQLWPLGSEVEWKMAGAFEHGIFFANKRETERVTSLKTQKLEQ